MILETPSTAAMIEAEDLSGFVKSAYFVSGKLLEWSDARLALMKLPPSTMDYLCVDGAELDTAKKAMEARPYLSPGLCTPHSLDLEVEDISKLTWAEKHMAEMKRVVKFLRGHGYSLFLWRESRSWSCSFQRKRASPRTSSCASASRRRSLRRSR